MLKKTRQKKHVRHGEKQEEEEDEVEQEVEGQEEENAQGRRHMCMDEME